MRGLLDFLQAASNSAADTVAAPVDLLSWVLRKGGVPVPENAVGGTKWMTEKGLRKDVAQSPESLAGETFAMISPIVAAAKAPQIAAGLIKAGENAAKPRTLNPEKGAIVWHGSPHKFSKFDSSKIGTGEGAQAYGHGLYLAEAPDVAQQYQRNLTAATVSLDGKPLGALSTLERAAADYATEYGGVKQALETLDNTIAYKSRFDDIDWLKQVRDKLASSRYSKNEGSLYKVDLPDPVIARMLDWDKPLSQQAPGVVGRMERALASDTAGLRNASFFEARDWLNDRVRLQNLTPSDLPWVENFGTRRITDAMREAGIPGIRYLDQGSRGAGAGTSNFVVFPGEENVLRILERNGKGLLD